jgi:chromosome segregation ATPase
MSANAFDTLKAAKSLEAAGFDEAQAEAIVATVGDAVRAHTEPLASGIASIADTMATKEHVATVEGKLSAVKDDVAALTVRVETISVRVETISVRVETLSGSVETLSGSMATKDDIADMATKDEVANMATKDSLAALADRVETISRTMATKEYVDAAIATLRAEIAVDFRNLYRHLWVMGTGFVGVTVALVKLLP